MNLALQKNVIQPRPNMWLWSQWFVDGDCPENFIGFTGLNQSGAGSKRKQGFCPDCSTTFKDIHEIKGNFLGLLTSVITNLKVH